MLKITQEMRHFESIFLAKNAERSYSARVFDLFEELDFAGHPVLGAACALHMISGLPDEQVWSFELKARTVAIRTRRRKVTGYAATLDQGAPAFLGAPERSHYREIAKWFGLAGSDLHETLPMEVVSTGLRYLIIPLCGDAIARARVRPSDLGNRLERLCAQFAYLLDIDAIEGRTWNNDGIIEDVATGSAAGCVAAYLRRHGRLGEGEAAILRQGRFTGRPSEIAIVAHGPKAAIRSVEISGYVSPVGSGHLAALP
jgi:PhzF family phenazine biosynthesis protein